MLRVRIRPEMERLLVITADMLEPIAGRLKSPALCRTFLDVKLIREKWSASRTPLPYCGQAELAERLCGADHVA